MEIVEQTTVTWDALVVPSIAHWSSAIAAGGWMLLRRQVRL